MDGKYVITIGRQFGSGGREIGMQLSEKLGIAYYDKEIFEQVNKQSGLTDEFLKERDEERQGVWTHALSNIFYGGLNASEHIYRLQAEAIRKLASEGSCVIVGRCADYILRYHPLCFNVFVHAPESFCAQRLIENDGISPDKVREMIGKVNKRRAAYYNFYTDKKWGDITSYHLTADSSLLGIGGTVDLIAWFVNEKLHQPIQNNSR